MSKSVITHLATAATAVLLLAVVMDRPGPSGTPSGFHTLGPLQEISVSEVGGNPNNGYPALLRDRRGNLWCAWVASRLREPLVPHDLNGYAEGDSILLRKRAGGRWSTAVTLNTNFGVNFEPALAEDPDGNIFVVWSSRRDGRYRLYARRAGQDLTLGSETQILPAGKLEGHPDIVTGAKGRLWLVAHSWRNGSQDIVFYTLENGGWRQMPDVSSSPDPDYRPRIAAAPDGSIWCAWDTYSRGKYRIMLRQYDPNADSWGAPLNVPGDGNLDAWAPAVAVDPKGRVWVAYARAGAEEPLWGLRGVRSGGSPKPTIRLVVYDGTNWSYPEPLEGDEPGAVSRGDLPRLAIGSDNAVWVIWQTLLGHVDWKVTAAVYRGRRWTGPFLFGMEEPVAIDGPPKRADQRAAVVLDPEGHALLAYERGRGVFRNRDIYLREVAVDGGAASEPYLNPFPAARLAPRERPVRRALKRLVVNDASGTRRQLFMGDLHNHLLIDDGHEGFVDQLFHVHRDRFAMDFAATTSHGDSNKLLISELAHNDALTESLLDTHTFVTIPGFEWTQGDFVVPRAGHRHVIYETIGGPLYRPTEGHSDSIREFVDLMSKTNGLLFAHHITRASTGGTDWSYVNVKVEPCVEICSSWGRFEYYRNPGHIRGPETRNCSVQDAWRRGLRLGVIGGSDGHNLFGDRIQGVTGVYATELKRSALFAAIRARHTFATTGEPIQLDFRVNGHLMGSEITAATAPVIEGEVIGTAPLISVEVVKFTPGAEPPYSTVFKAPADGQRVKFWWRDPEFRSDCFYYLRVTQRVAPDVAARYAAEKEELRDRFPTEMAWSSPVWVTRR